MARVGLQGVRAPIKDGTGVWACVHCAIAVEIAVAQDAEETDRATVSRDPGLGWGRFWKRSAHGRLASGSCRDWGSTGQRSFTARAGRGKREEGDDKRAGGCASGPRAGKEKRWALSEALREKRKRRQAGLREWLGWVHRFGFPLFYFFLLSYFKLTQTKPI